MIEVTSERPAAGSNRKDVHDVPPDGSTPQSIRIRGFRWPLPDDWVAKAATGDVSQVLVTLRVEGAVEDRDEYVWRAVVLELQRVDD